MRGRALAVTILAAALAACGPQDDPALRYDLGRAAAEAAQTAPCSESIPLEWPAMWPVPAEGRGEFKVLFYPIELVPSGGSAYYSPAGEAVLVGPGAPRSCRLLAGEPERLTGPRWPAAASAMSIEELEKKGGVLMQKTRAVGDLYTGLDSSPLEEALAKEYLALFESLAEPALLPYYYRANPAFWEWIRERIGRSIPKA